VNGNGQIEQGFDGKPGKKEKRRFKKYMPAGRGAARWRKIEPGQGGVLGASQANPGEKKDCGPSLDGGDKPVLGGH